MSPTTDWSHVNAIVTGAASGIGLALSRAMLARGATVYMTDLTQDGVAQAAADLGDRARPLPLDVRDMDAWRAVIKEVRDSGQRIDYLFNNAGIAAGGEVYESSAEAFDRITDINIRGVTNGVSAVYPVMVEQGHGHLVNTASAAGLMPVPLLAAYSMTKHAVVGLSESLRLEAEPLGVKVSVLCPSAIATPMVADGGSAEFPGGWGPNVTRYLTALAGPPIGVEDFVEYTLGCLERGTGKIIAPARTRVGALLYRLFPGLVEGQTSSAMKAERAQRRD